jgi:hypothetical protein
MQQVEAKNDVFFSNVRDLLAGLILHVLDEVVDFVYRDWRIGIPNFSVHGVIHRDVITEKGGPDGRLLVP